MTDIRDLSAGFRTGDWLVLPAEGLVRRGVEARSPEPLPFRLLMVLASRNGELVSKDELIEILWDNRAQSDAPLNRCVSQLRKVLDDKKPYQYIENVSRRGYRLKTPVESLDTGTVTMSPAPAPPARAGWLFPAVLLVALAVAISWWIGPPDRPDEVQTIGVLPFQNLSAADGSDYLVGGFKEELVNSLHGVPGLSIVNSRLSYDNLETPDIARKLGVSILLGGSVQRAGDQLKISFSMSNAEDGAVIVSEMLEGDVESLFELQSELAMLVRSHVLGEANQVPIGRRKPASFRAYDTYMRGLYAFDQRLTDTALEDAIELFRQTIELDPSFGPAYVKLATAYTLLPTYRSISMSEASRLALSALDRGADVDPSIVDTASAVRGFFHHMDMQWQAAEAAYERAINADIVDPTALLWYSRLLASVGRLDDSLLMANRALKMEPTSAVITSRVAMAYTWLGDYDSATEYFERSNALGAGGQTYLLAYALCLYQRGEIDNAYAVTTAAFDAAAGADDTWIEPVFAAFENPELAGAAVLKMHESIQSGTLPPQVALVAGVLLGDVESAFAVASRLPAEGEIFEMDLLFIPQTKPLREHEGFDALMSRLELTEYWQQKACTWQGQSFACQG